MHEWTLQDELRLTPLNLSRAALCFARDIAYPGLDIGRYVRQLNDLAESARLAIPTKDPIAIRAELLSSFLFQQAGFRGNQDDYSDWRNSFLNEVLERRLGIPITLSAIYLEVARQLDIPAQGVSLPGHFIVSVWDGAQTYYFDPFHGGGRLSVNDCALLVQHTTGYHGPFQTAWLSAVAPRDVLIRMLNNLRIHTLQQEMWAEAVKVLTCLVAAQADFPQHLRDLGLLYYRLGDFVAASRYLDGYLQRQPNAPDAALLRQTVAETLTRWASLN
ncbi:MAG: tetratricopeptide repeat protein [Ardenticatenaceae bacterium]|nr:tetratricopeptide repeat protein [Ardenticatenaceae bacterium]